MPIHGYQLRGKAADVTKLLALFGLRRSVEPQPAFELHAAMVAEVTTPANVTDLRATMQTLVELIAAIDKRLPQVERSGESAIANAAMALRAEALTRIGEIEVEIAGRESDRSPTAVVR
ncbi:MAG TPA: hypothetical protein VM096_06790 [Vicinamibacterales bacterium]|nr:hypothetical protein [Vicinamibacterales bacterium]